ncbi:MAG: RHS repeat domain-containing protein, partial [Pyrinomonadaceae bacterium]
PDVKPLQRSTAHSLHAPTPFHTTYDAAGSLVAEYSTIVASTNDAKVAYLTNDHLGSPRINTDANGAVTARHDYHPFGEEISVSQRTAGLGYAEDTIRKQFTGYERDNETELDFAQARMYAKTLGRFTTTDPLYFQREMIVDPQRFNLYIYTRNAPLKWVDPLGEKVRVVQGSSLSELYELVGGQDNFDRYFQVGEDGMVTVKDGVDISKANQGIQFLNQLIGRDQTFLIYLGADADAVAKSFAGTTNPDGSLNEKGKRIRTRFQKNGFFVGTQGRPNSEQPSNDVFTVLAINPATLNYVQTGVGDSGVEADVLQRGGRPARETGKPLNSRTSGKS